MHRIAMRRLASRQLSMACRACGGRILGSNQTPKAALNRYQSSGLAEQPVRGSVPQLVAQLLFAASDGKAVDSSSGDDASKVGDGGSQDGADDASPSASSADPAAASASNAEEDSDIPDLKPREIVSRLDQYIIGQHDAKRAIAVALRNRWRRMRVTEELRPEIMPKNILMVGPTGVGKTEIARRLAKLARAPFVKVEATKFTEVGFHGRDVDTIIRDLVEASMTLIKELRTEQIRRRVAPKVEDMILEKLVGPGAPEQEEFRSLLRMGGLEERSIEVDVPLDGGAGGGGGPGGEDIELSFGAGQTASVNPADLFRSLGGGRRRAPTESKRMPIREARPVLENAEIEEQMARLDLKKEAVHLAEQHGIVFIDEIDKIVSDKSRYKGGDASAEGVQRDLLPLIEGSNVEVRRFGTVKTDHMLFVCSGAFHEAKPSDMLAELQGRLPIRVELKGLTREDMLRILTEPKANLIRQQKALIEAEGVELVFDDDAVKLMAERAADINKTVENIGARRLHTVVERVMEDISFDASEAEQGSSMKVDTKLVEDKLAPVLKTKDLKKFIL